MGTVSYGIFGKELTNRDFIGKLFPIDPLGDLLNLAMSGKNHTLHCKTRQLAEYWQHALAMELGEKRMKFFVRFDSEHPSIVLTWLQTTITFRCPHVPTVSSASNRPGR